MNTKRIAIERLIESFESDTASLDNVTQLTEDDSESKYVGYKTSKTGTPLPSTFASKDYKTLSFEEKIKKLSVMQSAAMNIKRMFDTVKLRDGETKEDAFARYYGFSASDVQTLMARYRNGLRSLEKAVKELMVDYVKKDKGFPSKKATSDAIASQDKANKNSDTLLAQAQQVLAKNGNAIRSFEQAVKSTTPPPVNESKAKTRTFTSIY